MIERRDIFQAVADPTRRAILILLASQSITAGGIAEKFDAAKSTVSKHVQSLSNVVCWNQTSRGGRFIIN